MNRRTWTTTGLAIVAAAGLGVFAGCEQEATETYQYPETPAPDTPGARDTGTGADQDVGDVGPMGTTQDEGMIGGEGDATQGGAAGGGTNGGAGQ